MAARQGVSIDEAESRRRPATVNTPPPRAVRVPAELAEVSFDPAGPPRIGDTIMHRATARAALVLRIVKQSDGQHLAVISFAVGCGCHCAGWLRYCERFDCWCCDRCRGTFAGLELRRAVELIRWCSAPGCRRAHLARGLCRSCYDRWRGDLPHRRAAKAQWQARPDVRKRRAATERQAYAEGRRYQRKRDAAA